MDDPDEQSTLATAIQVCDWALRGGDNGHQVLRLVRRIAGRYAELPPDVRQRVLREANRLHRTLNTPLPPREADAAARKAATAAAEIIAVLGSTDPPTWFGEAVRDYRKLLGWTHEELAQRARVSREAVTQIELRRTKPSRSTIRKYAAALAIAPSDLWPAYADSADK